jgi:N-acetylmuramoyl-L-alanine amidase
MNRLPILLLALVATTLSASAQNPVGALSGKRVVISPGHGYYWHSTLGWTTQRPLIDDAVEDRHTNEIVMDHLLEWLEGAGATTIMVRGRSRNTEEHLIDNDVPFGGYSETGGWTTGASTGFGGTYRYASTSTVETARATFSTVITKRGEFPVYLNYVASSNRTAAARVEIEHAAGTSFRTVDMTRDGSRWVYLGTFPGNPLSTFRVHVTNASASPGVVIADAVRVGEGMGSIARGGTLSGQPRWLECSRYWAQFNGAPSSVWDSTTGEDSTDDVSCRPRYAQWWGVDAFFSLHTNAGGGTGTDSFIHNTNAPAGSIALRSSVHTRVVSDLRTFWDPNWTDRGEKTANFGEVNGAYQSNAAMLMELAFHDDPNGDLVSIHNPKFRRIAARAIYRGLAAYLAPGVPFTLDPPSALAVVGTPGGTLQVRWASVSGASGYRLRLSKDGFAFDDGVVVAGGTSTSWTFPDLAAGDVRFVKIAAINGGGTGPWSEPIGGRVSPNGTSPLLLVHAFDRRDRWVKVPDNLHDGMSRTSEALIQLDGATWPFDGATNEAVSGGLVALAPYRSVGWILGEESTVDETFSTAEQSVIGAYLAANGRFWYSGAEVGWDLDNLGTAADRAFYEGILGQNYLTDDAGTYTTSAVTTGPLAPLPAVTFDNGSGGIYNVDYPDTVGPVAGSTSTIVLRYSTGAGAAMLRGDGRVLGIGFPIDSVANLTQRAQLLEQVLRTMLPLPLRFGGAPTPGGSVPLIYEFPQSANRPFLAAAAFGTAPGIPLGDGREVPLAPDALTAFSIDPAQTIFTGMSGVLSSTGIALGSIAIPAVPGLTGIEFSMSAVTLLPSGAVGEIAPAVRLTLP